jgi:hypothetical protein
MLLEILCKSLLLYARSSDVYHVLVVCMSHHLTFPYYLRSLVPQFFNLNFVILYQYYFAFTLHCSFFFTLLHVFSCVELQPIIFKCLPVLTLYFLDTSVPSSFFFLSLLRSLLVLFFTTSLSPPALCSRRMAQKYLPLTVCCFNVTTELYYKET